MYHSSRAKRMIRATTLASSVRRRPLQLLQQQRCLGVYAMGEGWTGALGTGSLDSSTVLGHDDEEEEIPQLPLVFSEPTRAIAAGWGHSAIMTTSGRLLVSGRPHDFQALLRLKRLPGFIRNFAIQYSRRHYESSSSAKRTVVGGVLEWMMGHTNNTDDSNIDWDAARRSSVLPEFTEILLPNNDVPSTSSGKILDASAGWTAVIGTSGTLYTFGTNHRGQCGVGETTNNVWQPQKVMGLSTQFAHEGRHVLEQEFAITSVALGLQHGLALDEQGHVYAWGKGERGQLGQGNLDGQENTSTAYAVRVNRFRLPTQDGSRRLEENLRISKIAAGMNQSAALTDSNHVFCWGKNVMPSTERGKTMQDSPWPILVEGLAENLEIVDIACGSHHTAMLLEDGSVLGVGVTSDTAQVVFSATEMVPPGVVEMPCRFFDAHFDRTTIVDHSGRVFQVHLWGDEELQQYGVFTPPWVQHLEGKRIQQMQRGWLHTIVSTEN